MRAVQRDPLEASNVPQDYNEPTLPYNDIAEQCSETGGAHRPAESAFHDTETRVPCAQRQNVYGYSRYGRAIKVPVRFRAQ